MFLDGSEEELEAVVLQDDADDDNLRVVRLHELGYGRLGDGWARLVRSANCGRGVATIAVAGTTLILWAMPQRLSPWYAALDTFGVLAVDRLPD